MIVSTASLGTPHSIERIDIVDLLLGRKLDEIDSIEGCLPHPPRLRSCSISPASAPPPIMAAFCRLRSALIHARGRNLHAKDDVNLSRDKLRGDPMRKTLIAVASAATVAVAAVAAPTAAEARWGGGWHGGWRGPGFFGGGLLAGALIAGALAPRYYDYPGYYGYYGPGPYYSCWRRAWNGWRVVHYRVC
jgi:hypothetical protein